MTRHIWKEALETCEEIRHRKGMKELYQAQRKPLNASLGQPKLPQSSLYKRKGKSKMEDKVGLTLACLNLKKLVKMRAGKAFYIVQIATILAKRRTVRLINRKRQTSVREVCLHSETNICREAFWTTRDVVVFIIRVTKLIDWGINRLRICGMTI